MMISVQELNNLPPISVIYRIWHEGRVIYVGKTTNLRQRWRSHHLGLILSDYPGWLLDWVEVAPENLNRAEAFAHRHFKPELNQQNPSASLRNP